MKRLLPIFFAVIICIVPAFGQMGILTTDDKLYALEKEGKFDEAIADINSRIKLQPNNAELYLRRANFLRLQNKLDEAILDISKAIEIEPKNATFYIARAEFFNLAKNDKAVLKDVLTALALNPDKIGVLRRGTEQIFISEQYDENIKIADSYISRSNSTDELKCLAYKIRSENKLALKDYIGALEDAIKSIELIHFTGDVEKDFIARRETQVASENVILPVTRKYLRDDKRIFDYYNRIFSAWDGKVQISFELMQQQENKRRSQIEESDERRRFREENTIWVVIENYRRLLTDCAELYAEKGQPEKGIEVFDRVIKLKPAWVGYSQRVLFYKKLGKYQEAIDDLTVVLSDGWKRPGKYVERGDLYVLSKQFDKAIADYETEKTLFVTAEAKMNEKIAAARQKQIENENQQR